MKIVIVAAILGIAFAKIELEAHKQDTLFMAAYPSYPVLNRVTRAQPAIYPPDKALTWVEDYYERTYTPQPYSFAYDVNDGYNNYGHQQQSDGSVTSGSYRVLLPDGRTQIVNFRADKNGYVADVKYEVSLFKSAGSSYKAPVTPSYKAPAGQSKKAGSPAWTAFTAYRPDTKKPSYKADLIAAFGYKTPATPSAPAYKALIDQQYETPAAVVSTTPVTPEYKAAEYKTPAIPSAPVSRVQPYKPVAAPPAQINNGPTLPEYKSPSKPTYVARAVSAAPSQYKVPVAPVNKIPTAPIVPAYRASADRANKAPAAQEYKIPAPAPSEYKADVPPTYQVPSAQEYGPVKESAAPVDKVPVYGTPAIVYESSPTTPAYKAPQVYTTTTYRPPTTPVYTFQTISAYESTTQTPEFRPWTAIRYPASEASTTVSYEAPDAQAYIQPTTAGYTVAVTTSADRSPPPAYEAVTPAEVEPDNEITTVPAEVSTTPSSQNYAAPWTAFRAAELPSIPVYQSPSDLPNQAPATIRSLPSYRIPVKTYVNEAPTPLPTPSYETSTYNPPVYSDPKTPSVYEQSAPLRSAWPEEQAPSAYVPVAEATTYNREIVDETTTAKSYFTTPVTPVPVVYEATTTPSAYRAVPSQTRSPWAGFRPAPDASSYVAPTTYRPLTPAALKLPDSGRYESNTGSETSSSGPTWNAWTDFRSAPPYPAGRPGYETQTTTASSNYKLPPPLVYRNRKV